MAQEEAKGSVNSQGEREKKRMQWNETGARLSYILSCCVYLQAPWCSLSSGQVLVSQMSWASWSFLQCIESILQAPKIPKYSHCAPSLSLIMWPISRWDVWEAKQHRKLSRWKVCVGGRRSITKFSVCFASPDRPEPWDLMWKQSVCLFVPWKKPWGAYKKSRWAQPSQ